MPVLSRFLGIAIKMYLKDHNPPHFHVEYNEHVAEVDINTLSIKDGKLPPRIKYIVKKWAERHKEELMENWDVGRLNGIWKKIEPLK